MNLDKIYCDDIYKLLTDDDINNRITSHYNNDKSARKIINDINRGYLSLNILGNLLNKIDYGLAESRSIKKIISFDTRFIITNDGLVKIASNDDSLLPGTATVDFQTKYANDVYKLFTDMTFVHSKLTNYSRQQLSITIETYEKLYTLSLSEIPNRVITHILRREDYELGRRSMKSILANDRRFMLNNDYVKLANSSSSEVRDIWIPGTVTRSNSARSSTVTSNNNVITRSSTAVSRNASSQFNHLQYCDDIFKELTNRKADGWHSAALLAAFTGSRKKYGLENNQNLLNILEQDRRFIVQNDRFCLSNENGMDSNNENIAVGANNNNNNNNHGNDNDVQKFLKEIKSDIDKDGITIDKKITLFSQQRIVTYRTIRVTDTNRKKKINLIDVNFITSLGYEESIENFKISQKSRSDVTIQYSPSQVGNHKCIIVFHFDSGLKIARKISATCTNDKKIYEALNDGRPFRMQHRVTNNVKIFNPVDGEREPRVSPRFAVELKKYNIPEALREKVKVDQDFEKELQRQSRSLLVSDYSNLFSTLVFLEERQWELDIRLFDMNAVSIAHDGTFIALKVPGLAEKRPSVLRGDSVIFIYNKREYRGYVWRVELEFVFLRFHRTLHDSILTNALVDVVFEFKRTGLRLLHQGLASIKESSAINKLIHPINESLVQMQSPRNIQFINRNLNEQQRRAVASICSETTIAPFIIFGPPGTGKTETLSEAIKQMYRNSSKRILVMAPSNEATDNLLRRLSISIPRSDMFRLMSYNRERASVDPITMDYSDYIDDGFRVPPDNQLKNFRVIVSTLTMASKLHNMGLKSNHFDAFFIDEAGYCWEAEIISVLGVLHSKESSPDKIQRTVIAGDPKQLSAVVRSTLALKYGLGTSMIERLTNSEAYPYKKDLVLYPNTNGYNPTYIVKLLNCYRCHPQILKVSNESFYDNELIAAADPIKTQSMFRWEGLLNKTFPLIFHGVEGENKRDNSSPSWFNTGEIEICLDYVQQLRASMKLLGFTLKDIAIITPYNKQVSKIKQALKMIGCSEVACGSVETFQGQERKIIIISTVRSDPEFIGIDLRYNLGFVKNPKRFNVSVTRAIALMIVVGSPKVLNSDVYWSKLLWHCVDNNAYTGVQLPKKRPDGTDNDDGTLSTRLIAAIESFHINPKKNESKEMDEGINNTWKDVSDKDDDDDDDDSWEFVDNNDASRQEGGALGENRFQTNY